MFYKTQTQEEARGCGKLRSEWPHEMILRRSKEGGCMVGYTI